jgi:hypothetical protein
VVPAFGYGVECADFSDAPVRLVESAVVLIYGLDGVRLILVKHYQVSHFERWGQSVFLLEFADFRAKTQLALNHRRFVQCQS